MNEHKDTTISGQDLLDVWGQQSNRLAQLFKTVDEAARVIVSRRKAGDTISGLSWELGIPYSVVNALITTNAPEFSNDIGRIQTKQHASNISQKKRDETPPDQLYEYDEEERLSGQALLIPLERIKIESFLNAWKRGENKLCADFHTPEMACQFVIQEYQRGWSISTLSRRFGVGRQIIINLLLENDVPIRRRRFRNLQNARPYWECSFSKPTPKALYWAGFLMADGSIALRQGEPTIQCAVKKSDKDQIYALSKFVGRGKPTLRTIRGSEDQIGWRVVSAPMATDLAKWGIVPRKGKSSDTSPRDEACLSIDFWRGVIDGDGWIGWTGISPTIALTGRLGVCEAFREFLYTRVPLKFTARHNIIKIHDYPTGEAKKVILTSRNAVSLAMVLYDNAPAGLYLERKRRSAQEIISKYVESLLDY